MQLDIISNEVASLGNIETILISLITKNFVGIKRGKRAKNNGKNIKRKLQNPKFSISTISINSALKEVKNESKEKKSKEDNLEETTEEESGDKKEIIVNGGYGTISKHYGTSQVTKYVNYEKIWSNIGTFKTQGMYDNLAGSFSQSENKSTGVLVDNKVIEKAERHFKYFVPGDIIGDVGLVPPVGVNINSKDWEKYRTMTQMSIYRPLLALFRATA